MLTGEIGVRRFIIKSGDAAELERAIRAYYTVASVISAQNHSTGCLALRKVTATASPFDEINDREMEVL